ncbi:Phage integrase family protein [Prosthecobacter debontii]|uniref:Phage integrase family protein n=1 Tax=Prosthecobacter debontii TaxID=48467 RepID=A0A1T4Z2N5_9BACT|nr:site-specific integrase [Prosthecobacter debontii]SKB08216.1 Phage integrase family protein [Prosthecobacter debontii]
MAQKKRVVHKPVPQEAKNDMSKAPHVFLRGNVYYVRKRVPTELVPILNACEIKVSLKTSDRKKAMGEANYANAQLQVRFDEARKMLVKREALRPTPVKELAEGEIHRIVASYFIAEEKRHETWWVTEGQKWPQEDLETAWDNLTGDISHYQTVREKSGNGFGTPAFDTSGMAKLCLEEAGIELPPDSPSFAKLGELLRRALVETTARQIDRLRPYVRGGDVRPRGDAFFDTLNALSPLPGKRHTLGDLLEQFQKHHADNSSEGTQRTYNIPIRLLTQHFGTQHPLAAIGPQQIGDLLDLLKKVPCNAQQRYPDMSLQEAIEAANKRGDTDRLGTKTLINYHRNISAIFNFGKAVKLLEDNPVNSIINKNKVKGKPARRVPFEIGELQKLFNAPLYRGCVDDERNYAKPGESVTRRGRFWVPLLALYHGFRCNETCQLYTEDVLLKDDVWCIWISESTDKNEDEVTDKKIKNQSSERLVPIHKTVLDLGFLDYVTERRNDASQRNLFPELRVDKKGYRSNLFSKWFGRFKGKYIPTSKATFHGFRHTWRTQLTRFDISIEDVEQLGGWTSERRSSERIYSHGKTLPAIKAVLDRVEYPGLDLGHLAPQAAIKQPSMTHPRRFRPSA